MENLDRKFGVNVDVSGPVNNTHPASAQQTVHPVAPIQTQADQGGVLNERRPVIQTIGEGAVVGPTAGIASFDFRGTHLFPEGRASSGRVDCYRVPVWVRCCFGAITLL